MSEKPVEERLSVLENGIEHIKSTLDRVESLLSNLHNDIHNTQTQNSSNCNVLRSNLKLDIEAHRKEINEELDAHQKEIIEKLDVYQKEMREFFTSTIARLEANQSKLDDNQRSLNEKHARLSRDLVWLYIIGLSLFGTTVANANGWLSFIGKLFSAG